MKTPKAQIMKPAVKKKKPTEVKSAKNEDSISETISFVIKGKLTPIKSEPTQISSSKMSDKKTAANKIVKKKMVAKPKVVKLKKALKEKKLDNLCKVKTKVQIKTAKKSALKPGNKRIPDPISSQITSSLSNIALTPHLCKKQTKKVKPETTKVSKDSKTGKDAKDSKVNKDAKVVKPTKVVKETKDAKPVKEVAKDTKDKEVVKPKKVAKPLKTVVVKKVVAVKPNKKKPPKEVLKAEIKVEDQIEDIDTKETIEKLLEQANKALKQPSLLGKVKTKKLCKPVKPTIVKKVKNVLKEEVESDKSEKLVTRKAKLVKKLVGNPSLKVKKKACLLKKRKIKVEEDSPRESRDSSPEVVSRTHRVASLNALAKVHCLYENETRGNMLDNLELEYFKRGPFNIKKELIEREKTEVEGTTRTLRSAPGLRAVGKHWDMTDSTSSSEDNSSSESDVKTYKPKIKKEVVAAEEKPDKPKPKETKKTIRKRRRNQAELFMDLKDMVVRKRMASLNASAILAASYSTDRRSINSPTSENSYGDTDTESEEFISTDEEILKKKCFEDDVKKEEKLIEVHTTPNKKVAVILNQDTDVTITGVYVNSTTRSTHHEGYCSIAGMQYRISATSHTQTAATAVATETLLQSSSTSAPENSNSESIQSSKSYTPLDALSNMQPPPGPGIQHNHPHAVLHAAPPHVIPIPPAHQVSPTVRHGCPSAFTSPHASVSTGYPPHPSTVHHDDPAYLHGYYQPAGPLITVPHAHGQPAQQPPHQAPPPPLTKSAPLSEASPTSTSPPPPTHLPPPPPSSNGDSSDSEVIITSVTTAKEAMPQHPQTTYRFTQYPSTPPGYAYSYPPYPYPTPPPPSSYPHHDLCYPPSPYIHHKYPPPYRRYLPSSSYYPPNPQDVYPPPPAGSSAQPTQQVVTATPASGSGTGFQTVPSGAAPTIIETYSGPPPPTLVETYQPPPHYYPTAYGPPPPPPSCYTHSPSRTIPYLNATYQSCPCPMQSCPKNVLTGPLTGDSKRSNISSIAKDSMPLPPVRLALPLEPASATGPPSPARGSAGMPPPPSPAGATYQTPPAPKEESLPTIEHPGEETNNGEKKRKARIGKAMVRNDIMMRQNSTMLLMCNPQINGVKREIESPQDKTEEVLEEAKEMRAKTETESVVEPTKDLNDNQRVVPELKEEKESEEEQAEKELAPPEALQPCISTVAENVKVKNMKRKLSMSSENVPETKKTKTEKYLGSYKNLIKRDTSIKINNGKRKLLSTARVSRKPLRPRLKAKNQIMKSKFKKTLKQPETETAEKNVKKQKQKTQVNSKTNSKSESTLSNNVSNHIEETIESVVSEVTGRTVKKSSATANNKVSKTTTKDAIQNNNNNKKSTNVKKTKVNQQKLEEKDQNKLEKPKVKTENKKQPQAASKTKKTTKTKEVVTVAPRIYRRSSHPKWSNGWKWEGEPYESKVFINSDETIVTRICYPAMRHTSGDLIEPRDCVLLKAGPRKNDLPFVAKIAALWENPEDGEMMMSLLWYYRPEHTEQGRTPSDCPDEVFASRHKDSNSVACIDDKCYVLTFNEYCRYRKNFRRLEEGLNEPTSCIPSLEPYPRLNRQPPDSLRISPEMVFFCRRVYDFRQKRIIKNPS